MFRLIIFPFCLLLLVTFASEAQSNEIGINEQLPKDGESIYDNSKENQSLVKKPVQEKNLDDLLGPKDIFPFLPDNHRDSGTGKFNSF